VARNRSTLECKARLESRGRLAREGRAGYAVVKVEAVYRDTSVLEVGEERLAHAAPAGFKGRLRLAQPADSRSAASSGATTGRTTYQKS